MPTGWATGWGDHGSRRGYKIIIIDIYMDPYVGNYYQRGRVRQFRVGGVMHEVEYLVRRGVSTGEIISME